MPSLEGERSSQSLRYCFDNREDDAGKWLLISALAVVSYMIPANGTLKWSFSSLMAQTFATSPLVIYNLLLRLIQALLIP